MIDLETAQNGLGLVIITLDELSPAAFAFGGTVQLTRMIGSPAGQTDAAAGEPVNQHLIIHIDVHDLVDFRKRGECLSLRNRPRKTIQQIAALAVRLCQTFPDDINHDRIRNQIPRSI